MEADFKWLKDYEQNEELEVVSEKDKKELLQNEKCKAGIMELLVEEDKKEFEKNEKERVDEEMIIEENTEEFEQTEVKQVYC